MTTYAGDGSASLAGKLAKFFRERPNAWIDGRHLGAVAGSYGWRTRVSDLRRPPFLMDVENRQRRLKRPDGSSYTVSEYCFRPPVSQPPPHQPQLPTGDAA